MTVLGLKKKLVLQAIQALRGLNKQYYEDSSKKKPLLDDEEKSTLFLQVMLKKIPKNRLTKLIKVNLPHSLLKDTDEVCLITGDLDKGNRKAEIEPDILHYKAMLEDHGINCISEIITLRQLRTEYKPYEAKQKLLAAYDVFLADNKIAECLPRVLGKHFFKKRKFPIQINLKTPNLKQHIEKALSTRVFYITGHGNCCASEVASLDMTDSEILENVMTMVDVLSKDVPGTWCNVMGLYLKTARSKAIPLYMSYDGPNGVQLQEVKEEGEVLIDELSTIPNVRVKVYSDGKVETVRVEEVMETSFVETCESNAEENNSDSELEKLKNDLSDVEKAEIQSPKQEKSEKGAKSGKLRKKNMKKELVSHNQSPKKNTKHIKLEKVSKFANQKKKIVKKEPSQDQFQKKATKQVESGDTKPVKQKKKNFRKGPVLPSKPVANIEYQEENKMMALKRKRVKSESLLDSKKSVENTETPTQAMKKRKIEGINMKRYQSMKESRKTNKKKNQRRTKQEK